MVRLISAGSTGDGCGGAGDGAALDELDVVDRGTGAADGVAVQADRASATATAAALLMTPP